LPENPFAAQHLVDGDIIRFGNISFPCRLRGPDAADLDSAPPATSKVHLGRTNTRGPALCCRGNNCRHYQKRSDYEDRGVVPPLPADPRRQEVRRVPDGRGEGAVRGVSAGSGRRNPHARL